MKVSEHLQLAKKTLLSYEVLPPLKGRNIQSVYKHLDPLMEFKPSWVNVTYHRSETLYKVKSDGLREELIVRKRPGTVGICSSIMSRYNVDAIPHLICGGFSKHETEDVLIDLNFLGINNALLLRGDAAKNESTFQPHKGGHSYAIDLVKQVANLNKGIYLDSDILDGEKTNFDIGVAGYPEMHFEAESYEKDLTYLKAKVDAGANYIMTQMFFDNKKYFQFVKDCRNIGITVPIIPGLKPLTNKKQLQTIPAIFNLEIPKDLVTAIERADDAHVEQIGAEWLIQQCRELIDFGVPVLHFYTLGKPAATKNVVKNLF